MRTFKQVSAIRTYIRAAKEDSKIIGLVPTMGALHEGHLSLMRKARSECDVVVVSIFVNPTQFGPNEDLNRYPRSLARDSVMVQETGVDALFTPSVDEIYPARSMTIVDVPNLAEKLEGEHRPGHFRGVATVCAKFFNIVQPNRAYFGRKDYQQLKVIERMVADLHMPITIVPMPVVRESDGLAMSSRNAYLNPQERKAATVLFRALQNAEKVYNTGAYDAHKCVDAMRETVTDEPVATIDYANVVNADTLEPLNESSESAVALLAVRIGNTRLIDNAVLSDKNSRTRGKP